MLCHLGVVKLIKELYTFWYLSFLNLKVKSNLTANIQSTVCSSDLRLSAGLLPFMVTCCQRVGAVRSLRKPMHVVLDGVEGEVLGARVGG